MPKFIEISLKEGWIVALSERETNIATFEELSLSGIRQYPAEVPGNFELDLHKAGEIPDPFHRENIVALRRYETFHIVYGTRFNTDKAVVPTDFEPYLLFEGIDCFSSVFLNGNFLGKTDNGLIPHEFPVGNLLREGTNELIVRIKPTAEVAKTFQYAPGAYAAAPFNDDGLFIRKAPHTFGWDIMPRALSGGLWRPVKIVWKPKERIEGLLVETLAIRNNTANLLCSFEVKADTPSRDRYEFCLEGKCGSSSFRESAQIFGKSGRLPVQVQNPSLWWTRNQGDPNLYSITARLLKNGVELHEVLLEIGIRTIELKRSESLGPAGEGEFSLYLNGERIFILGTNHVPLDAYHGRDHLHLPSYYDLVESSGCNLLRCWGGNVYEEDTFFTFCDRHGILVWQDFAMACAVYPQTTEFQNAIRDEATAIVKRLRNHPCLAVWCGDNECDLVPEWVGRPLASTPNVLTRKVLPSVIRDHSPSAVYLPSSPYLSQETLRLGTHFAPEQHLWGPRAYFKAPFYTESLCRFVSEIGYHGCPHPDSIKRFISAENLWPPENSEWLLHATAPIPGVSTYAYRLQLMQDQVTSFFGEAPDDLDGFAAASQCVQAEAMKFFIEFFRSGREGTSWKRSGIVWWNLRDGWPQFSDAVVDYYFKRKLAFDYIRRAQSPVLVICREPDGWHQEIVACNDTRSIVSINMVVSSVDSGQILFEGETTLKANETLTIGRIRTFSSESKMLKIEWTGDFSGINHYLSGHPPFNLHKYLRWLGSCYPEFDFDFISPEETGKYTNLDAESLRGMLSQETAANAT